MSLVADIPLIVEYIINFTYYGDLINFSTINKVFNLICKDAFHRLSKCQKQDLRLIHFTSKTSFLRKKYFRNHCRQGHLLVAQLLADHFQLTDSDIYNCNAFLLACTHGHLSIAQWLTEKIPTAATQATYEYAILQDVCMQGHLIVAQWLVNKFGLTDKTGKAFRFACGNGHLLVAQWLTDKFKLTVDHARIYDNDVLRTACSNGYLPILQWLTDKFSLTAIDESNAKGLEHACMYRRTHVVEWLIDKFQITIDRTKDSLVDSCARGDSTTVYLLIAKFPFTSRRDIVRKALRNACLCSYLRLAERLVEKLQITAVDVRYNDNELLREICISYHLSTAKWLIDKFNLEVADIRSNNNEILREVCRKGDLETVKWLMEKFQLTTDQLLEPVKKITSS